MLDTSLHRHHIGVEGERILKAVLNGHDGDHMELAGHVELHLLVRLRPRTRAIVLTVPLAHDRVLVCGLCGLLQIAEGGLLRRVANGGQDTGLHVKALVGLTQLTLEYQVATAAGRREELGEAISAAHFFLLQGVP